MQQRAQNRSDETEDRISKRKASLEMTQKEDRREEVF